MKQQASPKLLQAGLLLSESNSKTSLSRQFSLERIGKLSSTPITVGSVGTLGLSSPQATKRTGHSALASARGEMLTSSGKLRDSRENRLVVSGSNSIIIYI